MFRSNWCNSFGIRIDIRVEIVCNLDVLTLLLLLSNVSLWSFSFHCAELAIVDRYTTLIQCCMLLCCFYSL